MSFWSKIEVSEENKYLQDTQIIGAVAGLALHILFFGMFALFKVHFLMWFNVFISIPAFTFALYYSFKGKLKFAPIIGTIEITIHQVLAVLLLGQESGFQLLLFCLIITGILFRRWKVALVVNSLICFILQLAFIWFDSGQNIIYDLSVSSLRFMKSVNYLGLFTIVGTILFYYIVISKKLHFKLQATIKELYSSNENLNSTLGIVEKQKEKIEKQHRVEIEQNKNIKDSINYAKRIQQAVLPAEDFLDKINFEHFVFFKPRDVVSGDFYWFKHIREYLVIAVADCTGHGVPGAFMSMLGIAFLNEIILRKEVVKSSQVLDILREEVKLALKQTGSQHEQRDGMDIAFCTINTKTKKLQFAGANSPLYIVRKSKTLSDIKPSEVDGITSNGEYSMFQLKVDRQPISSHLEENPFTNYEFELYKGDELYMFSDGFQDQRGGKNQKKFMAKKFKELLLQNSDRKMHEQKVILENTFETWKGKDNEQTDDVLIVGLKIPD